MALATIAQFEQFHQVDITNDADTAVQLLLDLATGVIESYVGRTFALTSYSETYSHPRGAAITLNHAPIDETTNAVTVTDDGTLLTVSDDYLVRLRSAQIVRVDSGGYPTRWVLNKRKPDAIAVTYDAGWDLTTTTHPTPLTARQICLQVAGRAFWSAATVAKIPAAALGVSSVKLEGSDSVTYNTDTIMSAINKVALIDEDRATLATLRRTVLR